MYRGNNGDLLIDKVFNESVAEILKEMRKEKKISLQDLSEKMGGIVTRQTLNRYELGLSKIRMNVFFKFAEAYNIEPKELYEKINMRYISKLSKYTEEIANGGGINENRN